MLTVIVVDDGDGNGDKPTVYAIHNTNKKLTNEHSESYNAY